MICIHCMTIKISFWPNIHFKTAPYTTGSSYLHYWHIVPLAHSSLHHWHTVPNKIGTQFPTPLAHSSLHHWHTVPYTTGNSYIYTDTQFPTPQTTVTYTLTHSSLHHWQQFHTPLATVTYTLAHSSLHHWHTFPYTTGKSYLYTGTAHSRACPWRIHGDNTDYTSRGTSQCMP